MRREHTKNSLILFFMILSGIVIGGFLGDLLGKQFPVLKFGYQLGVTPHTWDLGILKLTLGLTLNISMFSVLGIILAIYFYRKF